MKKTMVVLALAFAGSVMLACELGAGGDGAVVAAAAAQEPKGCSMNGSWTTAPGAPIAWLCTMDGTSVSSGTIVCDVPRWPADLALGGLAPTAVRITALRGAWHRIGGNTFAFTQVGWVVDAAGAALYVVRNSGTGTVIDGCDEDVVRSTMEFFGPDLGPIDADPMTEGVQPLPPADVGEMIGYRVEVTPPPAL